MRPIKDDDEVIEAKEQEGMIQKEGLRKEDILTKQTDEVMEAKEQDELVQSREQLPVENTDHDEDSEEDLKRHYQQRTMKVMLSPQMYLAGVKIQTPLLQNVRN